MVMSLFKVLITTGALLAVDVCDVQRLLSDVTVDAADSIRTAVDELEKMAANDSPSAFAVVVLALEDLGREPGSVQSQLALHQNQQRLILIATCGGEQGPSSLIYPMRIDVLTGRRSKPEHLARYIIDEKKKYESRIALGRAGDIISGIGAPILVASSNGKITWSNALAAELFRLDPGNLVGMDIHALFALDLQSRTAHRMALQMRALRPDTTVELVEFVVQKGMRLIRLSCTARRMPFAESDEIALLLRDTSAQHEQYAEYQLSAKVFEHSGEAIMITDHKDCILKVNEGFTRLTGYAGQDVIGRLPTFLNAGREPSEFYDDLWKQVHEQGHWTGELWHRRKDGEPYAAWCAISAVRDVEGEVDHYISIFTDVTERKMRDEHRLYQSQLDMLTGLPNRVLLADRFAQIVARHARNPGGIALLFIDLDGFKPINDNHGHHIGDELLRVVAERLSTSVRSSDTVSRYGGDEFVCLLDGLEESDAPQKVAATILNALTAPIAVAEHTLTISASIGISVNQAAKPDLSIMMAHADDAMYHAKRAGRGRWHVAPESSP